MWKGAIPSTCQRRDTVDLKICGHENLLQNVGAGTCRVCLFLCEQFLTSINEFHSHSSSHCFLPLQSYKWLSLQEQGHFKGSCNTWLKSNRVQSSALRGSLLLRSPYLHLHSTCPSQHICRNRTRGNFVGIGHEPSQLRKHAVGEPVAQYSAMYTGDYKWG